jgi:hypothetical protein
MSGSINLNAPAATAAASSLVSVAVPDASSWTTLAGSLPFTRTSVFRVGSTLYGFGGKVAGSPSAKIWTAPYASDGSTPSWTDSGAVLPYAADLARVILIGSTLYIVGAENEFLVGRILSAPLSTPLVWTDTGHATAYTRFNAPAVVTDGIVAIVKGNDGTNSLNSITWAPTSAVTGTWTVSSGGGNTALAVIAYASRGVIYSLGGQNGATFYNAVDAVRAAAINTVDTGPAPFPFAVGNSAAAFHLGSEIVLVGADGGQKILRGNPDAPQLPWSQVSGALPVATSFIDTGAWIGGDGAMYFIMNGVQYRSGTRLLRAPSSGFDPAQPYAAVPGVFPDGSPGYVSTHQRLGVAPWQTDRRTAF